MTRRERVLGLVFLAGLSTFICLVAFQFYTGKLRSMDERITKAELKKAQLELKLAQDSSRELRRQPWTASEAAPDVFLSRFDRIVRSAGWGTESTIFKGRKDGLARFSIVLTGPNAGFWGLVSALARWDKKLNIESIEATAYGSGRLRVTLEAGYETK
jgi:hypothetical protein